MQVYLVGGAVRDEMLGLAIGERDWVVVGATPAELTRAGYRPVGRDFPVFLHPESNEEYALARLERKTAPGYRGFVTEFSPSVTLEQDLARRDLTINAMARAADGTLIDPHGGERDLAARVLRHVSPAFIEDPVRILRLARFAARFAPLGFVIAPDTMTLMQRMVADGEAAALVPERVWQELVRALGEAQPARFFGVLRDCGALHVILPEIDDAVEEEAASIAGGARCGENPLAEEPAPALAPGAPPPVGALAALRAAVRRGERGTVRFATLLAGLPIEDIESLCTRLKAPSEYRELALLAARSGSYLHAAGVPPPVAAQDPEWLLGLLEHADAFRRAERFNDWLAILSTRAMAGGVPSGAALAFSAALHARREQLMAVKLPADTLLAGAEYGAALRLARLEALRALARSAPLAAPPT